MLHQHCFDAFTSHKTTAQHPLFQFSKDFSVSLWKHLVLIYILFPIHASCFVLNCFFFYQSHLLFVFFLFFQIYVYNQNFRFSFKNSKMNYNHVTCLADISPSPGLDRNFIFSALVSASIASSSEFFLVCISTIYTLCYFSHYFLYY